MIGKIIISGMLAMLWSSALQAAEPMPEPFVRLLTRAGSFENGDEIAIRPGEKVLVQAMVYGGRRAWCMEPQRYANMGRNTQILAHGENFLSFTTGSGFKGDWKVQAETAAWYGSLGTNLQADAGSSTATITGPAQPGKYVLKVKATATWHYVRVAQGMKREKDEVNEAEASFTVAVGAGDAWFSSHNIVASGDEDDVIRFQLQGLQKLFDSISRQVLNGDYRGARTSQASLRETLTIIKNRLDQMAGENPARTCKITIMGLPTDRGMECLQAFEKADAGIGKAFLAANNNAYEISRLLLTKKISFTNNVLKSVFKNYLDWAVGLPNFNDLYEGANTMLALSALKDLAMPLNLMQWYTTAMGDAAILKNQAQSMQQLKKLQAFYERVRDQQGKIRTQVNQAVKKNEPVRRLDGEFRAILQRAKGVTWKVK